MELFLLILVKYVFGFIFQDFFVILGVHTFSNQKVTLRNFLLINSILIPVSILVRFLPISFGIHILLNIAVIFYLTCKFCKFELNATIRSTLITVIILLLNEMFSVSILMLCLGPVTMETLMANEFYKAAIYVPFNFLYGFIIFVCYRRMLKKHF